MRAAKSIASSTNRCGGISSPDRASPYSSDCLNSRSAFDLHQGGIRRPGVYCLYEIPLHTQRSALRDGAQLQRAAACAQSADERSPRGSHVPPRRRRGLREESGQKVPQGYYNIADMLSACIRRGGKVGVCGTCIDARGIAEGDLVEGTARGTMDQLTEWTAWADKVLVF